MDPEHLPQDLIADVERLFQGSYEVVHARLAKVTKGMEEPGADNAMPSLRELRRAQLFLAHSRQQALCNLSDLEQIKAFRCATPDQLELVDHALSLVDAAEASISDGEAVFAFEALGELLVRVGETVTQNFLLDGPMIVASMRLAGLSLDLGRGKLPPVPLTPEEIAEIRTLLFSVLPQLKQRHVEVIHEVTSSESSVESWQTLSYALYTVANAWRGAIKSLES